MFDDLEFVLSGNTGVPGFQDRHNRLYRRAVGQGLIRVVDVLTARDLVGPGMGKGAGDEDDLCLHALLISMFGALNEKKICMRVDGRSLGRMLDLFVDETDPVRAETLREKLEANPWPWLIGTEDAACKPLVYVCNERGRYLYFQRYFKCERRVKEELKLRLKDREMGEIESKISTDAVQSCIREVVDAAPARKGGAPLRLNDEQKAAVRLALVKNFVLVSGGPGTGKTSIVVTLLRCLLRDPFRIPLDRIRLAASTGRAANRLLESIRTQLGSIAGYEGLPGDHPDKKLRHVKAETIHRMLRYSPARNAFIYNAENPLPADVVVIDEVSMLDVSLMADVLMAVPAGGKIIFLGDRRQLPSVEVGAVLPDLIPPGVEQRIGEPAGRIMREIVSTKRALETVSATAKMTDRVVLLKHSFRNDVAISNVAETVNKGRAEEALALLKPLVVRFAQVEKQGGRRGRDAEAGHVAVIRWPQRKNANHGKPGAPGQGAFRIDTGTMTQAEMDLIAQGWARHQYLSRDGKGASLADLVHDAGREMDLNDPDHESSGALLRKIFDHIESSRILSPFRHGLGGSEGLNRCVGRFLCEYFDPARRDMPFSGMPIVVRRNDHIRQLYNGDIGVILRGSQGAYRAVFPRLREAGIGFVSFAIDTLPPFDPAFAITVHKSQGAEYDQVFLVLPQAADRRRRPPEDDMEGTHRLLTREVLYTGITRARHAVVICCGEDVLRASIANAIEHESGIGFWEKKQATTSDSAVV